MAKRKWIVQLAVVGWGVSAVALSGGCPQEPDYPPFVRSGPAGGSVLGGAAGGPADTGAPEMDGGDGGAGNGYLDVTCVFNPKLLAASLQALVPDAGGQNVCAVLIEITDQDDLGQKSACTLPSGGGALGGVFNDNGGSPGAVCPATNSASQISIGCCKPPASLGSNAAFINPNYVCYYAPVSEPAASSACMGINGTWGPGPPLPQ